MNIIEINTSDIKYPQRLLRIKNFPSKIYAVGNVNLLNSKYIVAIVGSRKCSEYGIKVASTFSQELSKNNICIISGMAIGIDGISHNSALDEPGKTIAVLGSGFNHIYPIENEWLFHKILEKGGCIISEYSPEVEPDKSKFPIRNRIISGMSDAVLVIEALARSGSTITAKYAKEEGKLIYAIPNNIYSSTGIGTNKLIQNGAILVTKPSQIINDLINNSGSIKNTQENNSNIYSLNTSLLGTESIVNSSSPNINTSQNDKIPKEYIQIYKQLSVNPIHINQIARTLNKPIHEISQILTLMEIDGYAYQPQTNYFSNNI